VSHILLIRNRFIFTLSCFCYNTAITLSHGSARVLEGRRRQPMENRKIWPLHP